jgi:hypothetical protein
MQLTVVERRHGMSRNLPCVVAALFAAVVSPRPQGSSGEQQASGTSCETAGRVLWRYEAGG